MYIRDTLKQVQGDRGWLSQRYSSQEPVLAQPEPIKCIIPQKTLYYPILPSSERATYHSEAATPLALIEAATPLAPKLQNRIAANLQTSKPPNLHPTPYHSASGSIANTSCISVSKGCKCTV